MTFDELKKEYGDNNVFKNQFEMSKAAQIYGVRNNIRFVCERYPDNHVKCDPEVLYDFAEKLLVKNIAFFNDGYYIIEDMEDLRSL